MAPQLAVQLHEMRAAGDAATLTRADARYVVPLYAFRGRRQRATRSSVMKAMMQLQGDAAGPVRPPLANVNASELDELRAMMETWAPYL